MAENLETLATLPPLAKAISAWFPELGGRVLPVSDSVITKENIPTLPLCQLAFMKGVANKKMTNDKRPAVDEMFVIEFWYAPVKYTKDGKDTPFWAFYDYDRVMSHLFALTTQWLSPRNSRLDFIDMDVDSTELAVIITFRFTHTFYWCMPDDYPFCDPNSPEPFPDGMPFQIFTTVQKHADCCEPEPEPDPDPCAMPSHSG